jgi:hypothetical protein
VDPDGVEVVVQLRAVEVEDLALTKSSRGCLSLKPVEVLSRRHCRGSRDLYLATLAIEMVTHRHDDIRAFCASCAGCAAGGNAMAVLLAARLTTENLVNLRDKEAAMALNDGQILRHMYVLFDGSCSNHAQVARLRGLERDEDHGGRGKEDRSVVHERLVW